MHSQWLEFNGLGRNANAGGTVRGAARGERGGERRQRAPALRHDLAHRAAVLSRHGLRVRLKPMTGDAHSW